MSKKAGTTYSQSLIVQARRADQRRSGDEEWEACKANHSSDDIVEVLGDCFCLTTAEAACGADSSQPAD
jgi:hypothetical protein